MILPKLPSQKSSLSYFQRYQQITDIFCDFLSDNYNIKARSLPPCQKEQVTNRFLSFDKNHQAQKLNNFTSYYNLCREFTLSGLSLNGKQKCLHAYLRKFGLKVPFAGDVFNTIESDSFIEVYDTNMTQTYRSPDFFEATGHGLMTLETLEYYELFERADSVTYNQNQVLTTLIQGRIKDPIFKPIDDHSVKEINSDSPRSTLIEVKVYSPLFDEEDNYQGILHVFKIHDQRSLKYQLIVNNNHTST